VPFSLLLKTYVLSVQGIRLEEHPMGIQLIRQPLKGSPHVDLSGGIAGLADRHTERSRAESDTGLCIIYDHSVGRIS
jgi:hypothetical protein